MPDKDLVVLSTAPDAEVGGAVAATLVRERLAACVNIVAGVRSLYWWDGEVQDDSEVLLVCKTDAGHLDALTAALIEQHPYDCPEVIALPIVGGSDDYLSWLRKSLAKGSAD